MSNIKKSEKRLKEIKNIAAAFSKHINNQFQKQASYVPNTETIPKVSISSWLELSKVFQDEIQLPGFPIGNITHVYGKPDTGKTTLLMEGIVAAQKQGLLPILILTEHKFDFKRLIKMGGDPFSLLVFHAESIEEAYGYIEKCLRDIKEEQINVELPNKEGELEDIIIDLSTIKCFIFLDSIGNTMSDSELEYDIEDHGKGMGKGAKAIKTLTRRTNQLLNKVRQKVGILLLNQSYMSMPVYGPSVETPYGGDGIIYSCVLNLRFRRIKDIKMAIKGKEVIIGRHIKIEVKKNHITHLMPIGEAYVTGIGIIPADTSALSEYKKLITKREKKVEKKKSVKK